MNTLCVECGESVLESEDSCSNCGTARDISSEETMDSNVDGEAQTIESSTKPLENSKIFVSEQQLIGHNIGGAVVKKQIGKGGMGSVFLGHHETLDIPVAIKFLKPDYAQRSPDAVERFLKEARAVAKLRHPNIVSVYNAGCEKGFYFMSMEFIKGRDLAEILQSPFNLSLKDALKLTCQVCDALAYAHKNNIVHRDIKPANIFVDEEGNAKVGDLGLAKDLEEDQSMTQSMQAMGTPYYISPEQATSAKDVDHRSDIYSLGCTFYRLFCGKVPFKGNSSFETVHKHISEPVPDPKKENPEIPDPVAEVIIKMMAKKPEERFQSLNEVSKILRELLDDLSDSQIGFAPKKKPEPEENKPEESSEVKPQPASSNKILYGVIAGLIVVLLVIVLGKQKQSEERPAQLTVIQQAKSNLDKGNYVVAKSLYKEYFKNNLDMIDAHLDYTILLKQMEGIEGARNEYRRWSKEVDNKAVSLAYIQLLNEDSKQEGLKEFEAKFPDFGPFYYYASLYWYRDPATQTFFEKREERRLLQKFQELDDQGNFLKFYANRQFVDTIRVYVAKRLKTLEEEKLKLDNPVSLKLSFPAGPANPSVIIGGNSTNRSMLSVIAYVYEGQHVKEFFYGFEEKGEYKSLWKYEGKENYPVLTFKIEDRDEPLDVFVKYEDKKGHLTGPLKITVNRSQAKIDAAKNVLKVIKENWVSYRDYDNKLLLYFTSILSYSKGLREIRYSIDSDKLDLTHPFNPANPYENVYIVLPPETKSIFLQLTYKDDTKSDVIEYKKPVNLRKE